jgi:hypothetical protein
MLSLVGLACTAYGQNIFTVAGVPYGHRKAVDGQPALHAPLNFVYGLLFDRVTGRLLFHDQTLVEGVESDGSLLALVGRGEPQDATTADGTLASNLQISILRGMAQDAAGNLYLADAGAWIESSETIRDEMLYILPANHVAVKLEFRLCAKGMEWNSETYVTLPEPTEPKDAR